MPQLSDERRKYLSDYFSSLPGVQVVDLLDYPDVALPSNYSQTDGYRETLAPAHIRYRNPVPEPETIRDWMLRCLNWIGDVDQCYVLYLGNAWVQIQADNQGQWLSALWGRVYPNSSYTVDDVRLLSSAQDRYLTRVWS